MATASSFESFCQSFNITADCLPLIHKLKELGQPQFGASFVAKFEFPTPAAPARESMNRSGPRSRLTRVARRRHLLFYPPPSFSLPALLYSQRFLLELTFLERRRVAARARTRPFMSSIVCIYRKHLRLGNQFSAGTVFTRQHDTDRCCSRTRQ